jgi:hypothetical protein
MMKTPYELLIGRKPSISYFRVFGCKCLIFKKRKHLGKFESRVDEGIFVGCASNSKAYRVFNNSTRVIQETCDVEFDDSNGFQGDGFCCDDVGKEPLREAMKKMAIGDIKPKEDNESHSIHEDSPMMMMIMMINQGIHLHLPQDKIVHLLHNNHVLYHKTLKIK